MSKKHKHEWIVIGYINESMMPGDPFLYEKVKCTCGETTTFELGEDEDYDKSLPIEEAPI